MPLNAESLDFTTFCIGNLATRLSLNQREVYNKLKEAGLLYEYIVSAYDVLHTFGKEYLMEDLVELMKERGVLER